MKKAKTVLVKKGLTKKGMTLVEVLVALSLLSLIILVFTPLFMNYYKNIRKAGEITRQTYSRASLMERLVANKGKANDTGYETDVSGVPISLTSRANASTSVSFPLGGKNVNGFVISENNQSANSYSTFYTIPITNGMTCFPASITDDFLKKDITLVSKGFVFDDAAEDKNETGSYNFKVYNADRNGTGVPKDDIYYQVDTKYYDIKYKEDDDGTRVAVFTLKGGNGVICFENSPLRIDYADGANTVYTVYIEIGAPEIILVGEKPQDSDKYYYYATAGVDLTTENYGKMDIVAKEMSGAPLTSAMNDVEWVEKGRGDNGSGGVNKYGYYIMGGDAGQVRRFWKQSDYEAGSTSENYCWGGDDIIEYNRYMKMVANGSATGDSYETMTPKRTTQASFKSIFSTNDNKSYTYNGNLQGNKLMGSTKFSIIGAKYQAITSEYYTANVTGTKNLTTVGRVLNRNTKSGGDGDIYAGNSTESWVSQNLVNKHLTVKINSENAYGTNLSIDGYRKATGYNTEYPSDDSLITITSVGAIQVNTAKNSKHQYYAQEQEGTIKKSGGSSQELYPQASYSLYCGYIPAVTNVLGWASGDADYYLAAELGVATNGSSWYPTGKFADTKTTSSTLSSAVFKEGQSGSSSDALSWKSLLNFGKVSSLYPAGAPKTQTVKYDKYKKDTYTKEYSHRISYHVTFEYYEWFQWKPWDGDVNNAVITTAGGTDGSYRTGKLSDGVNSRKRNIQITQIFKSEVFADPDGDGVYEWIDDGNAANLRIEDTDGDGQYCRVVEGDAVEKDGSLTEKTQGYTYVYRKPVRDGTGTKTVTEAYRYYGPTAVHDSASIGTFLSSTSDEGMSDLTARSFVGTALPEQGNDYYITAGREVDVTIGYLSQPYAISVLNPEIPTISGATGSDYYFGKYGSNIKSNQFDHSFFSGGLRDNVTMLDVKSFHDDITGNNISMAVGYSLSYIFNDYSWMMRLGQVMNNGMVYIRSTGDGTIDSENETEGDLNSGRGWSLAQETNIFHQFYGIDQYQDNSGTSTALGWDTSTHRAYFNLAGDPGGLFQHITGETKAPQVNYSPNITKGTDYGTNCHPMAQTECTTVNWGTTWDEKPQAMWGTSNGSLFSWAVQYNSENLKNTSKVTSVTKEFENYTWADNIGASPKQNTYYDYNSVNAGNQSKYGFISVLSRVNDVAFSDGIWVAVGNQSTISTEGVENDSSISDGKAPSSYCASASCYTNGGVGGTSGGAGSYVNVKFKNGNGDIQWIAVKISTDKNINIQSVVNCQGVWYLMGWVDKDRDGINDSNEPCVMYFSTHPESYWSRCRTVDASGDYTAANMNSLSNTESYAVYYDSESDKFKDMKLGGINKMASQG